MARFADSSGLDENLFGANAYRLRGDVIRAFNLRARHVDVFSAQKNSARERTLS